MKPHKKVYVCGPMSGYPNFNFTTFDRVAECLRAEGVTVFNPHEHDQDTHPNIDKAAATLDGDLAALVEEIGFDLHEAMRWDLARVAEADCLVLLPGWEESTGARAERLVAEMTGTEIWLAHPHDDRFDFVLDPIQKRLTVLPKQTIVGEVRVIDPTTGGAKGRKAAQFSRVPADVLWELAEHYGKGEDKYPSPDDGTGRMNWQLGYDWRLSIDALERHLSLFKQGEDIDPETGSSHLTAVMWHAVALRWFQLHDAGTDTRLRLVEEATA